MPQSRKKNTLSTDNLFYFYIFATLAASIVISIILIGGRAEETIYNLQVEASEKESQLKANNLQQFLITEIKILQDLAQKPILANAVMGSQTSVANLVDFLDDYVILGNKEYIQLSDISGDIVYENFESTSQPSIADAEWFSEIINGHAPHIISTIIKNQRTYFKIIIPVIYNGYVEGILTTELSTSLNKIFKSTKTSQTHAIILSGRFSSYSNVPKDETFRSIRVHPIESTELLLEYFVKTDVLDQQKSVFMIELGKSIVISISISFVIIFFFSRKLFLNPFKQLKNSEAELRESEERYHLAVSGSNDGIWDWNIGTKEAYFSPRYRELLGYLGDDLEGFPNNYTSFESNVHPEDKPLVRQEVKLHLEKNKRYDVEYRLLTKEGNYRYFRAKGNALRGENGQPTRMAGSITDITQQKQFERHLRQAKERNDLLVKAIEFSPLGIVVSDPNQSDMPIIFVNSSFEQITGYKTEEAVGRNCRFLQGEETDPESINILRQAIKQRKETKVELLNYKKDGTPFWNEVELSPIFDQQNHVTAFVGIQQDTTERKNLAIYQEQARKAAEDANIAKSQFLASMSHEIRTPMNGVLGLLELLEDSKLDQDQLRQVQLARGSAKSLLSLINDILDFSKVDAGKLELEEIDFNLVELIGDYAETAAFEAEKKDVELILDMTEVTEFMVNGDPGRLRQIITNIVGNAVKFTKDGEILIKFSQEKNKKGLWNIACQVTDTGIGIPNEKVNTLFESFHQVDASTTREYGGTGLGLAIVKKLCQLMGGDVYVSSRLNRGSCFKFNIELKKSKELTLPLPNLKLNELSLLIVDDNQTSSTILSKQLSLWGASTIEAQSAEEALQYCEQRISNSTLPFFDLCFIDMQMPKKGGVQLSKEIKSNSAYSSMKLVMMTPLENFGKAQNFTELGISSYFPKPALITDLLKSLAAVSDLSQTAHYQANKSQTIISQTTLVNSQHDFETGSELTGQQENATQWLSNLKILLVEDNRVNQIVAANILKKIGASSIEIANNGVEAIEKLQAASTQLYSLIIMDCQMPQMDGYEATRNIRRGVAGEAFKKIPILAVTANAMERDEEKCLEAGMNDYLSKPIDSSKLYQKIHHMFFNKH